MKTEDLYVAYLLHAKGRLNSDEFWTDLFTTNGIFSIKKYVELLTPTDEEGLTSRGAPTGHKLFNFISTSLQPRRWAHIKRSPEYALPNSKCLDSNRISVCDVICLLGDRARGRKEPFNSVLRLNSH